MPGRTLTFFDPIGALAWAIAIDTVGFFFGRIPFVAAHIDLMSIATAVGRAEGVANQGSADCQQFVEKLVDIVGLYLKPPR